MILVVVQSPSNAALDAEWQLTISTQLSSSKLISHTPTFPAPRWWGFCYGRLWGPPVSSHIGRKDERGAHGRWGTRFVFGYLLFNVSPTCQTTIWKTVVPQPSHNVGISRCSAHAAALHKDERLNCGWGADHLSARDLGGLNLSPRHDRAAAGVWRA